MTWHQSFECERIVYCMRVFESVAFPATCHEGTVTPVTGKNVIKSKIIAHWLILL